MTVVKHKIDIVAFYTLESSYAAFNFKVNWRRGTPTCRRKSESCGIFNHWQIVNDVVVADVSSVTLLVPTDLDSWG
jgi:hypothetical protein